MSYTSIHCIKHATWRVESLSNFMSFFWLLLTNSCTIKELAKIYTYSALFLFLPFVSFLPFLILFSIIFTLNFNWVLCISVCFSIHLCALPTFSHFFAFSTNLKCYFFAAILSEICFITLSHIWSLSHVICCSKLFQKMFYNLVSCLISVIFCTWSLSSSAHHITMVFHLFAIW